MVDYTRDAWFTELRTFGYTGALEDMMFSHFQTLGTGNSLLDLLFSIDPTACSLEEYIRRNEPTLIPLTGLLALNIVDLSGNLEDVIGTSDRENQLRQYGTFLNGETLTSASIVGTETVISSEGTCTPVVSAGTITFDAGTCWNIVLSNGSTYSHPTKTGAAAGIWFDRSGASIHLTVNVADIDAHVTEAIDQGSNTLELEGYTVDTTTYSITALIPLLSDLSTDCLGNTPTYTGRAKYSLTPKNGACATFDGVGDYIQLDSTITISGDFTVKVSCTINVNGANQVLLGHSTGTDELLVRYVNSTSSIALSFNGTSISSVIVSDGDEIDITISREGTSSTLLVEFSDGTSSSDTQTIPTTNGIISIIGARGSYLAFYAGNIWNVNINNQAIFPLSESAGTTVYGYDSEGNTYTGAITASDIGAFWGSTQDSFFHDWEYGWELSGSIRIPGNPYTGLSCAGNTLTTQPYQLTANDWSFPATGELRDADDIILADTGSRFIYDTDGATPLDWNVTDITDGNINNQIIYGNNKASVYEDAQVDPALTKILTYHGLS